MGISIHNLLFLESTQVETLKRNLKIIIRPSVIFINGLIQTILLLKIYVYSRLHISLYVFILVVMNSLINTLIFFSSSRSSVLLTLIGIYSSLNFTDSSNFPPPFP